MPMHGIRLMTMQLWTTVPAVWESVRNKGSLVMLCCKTTDPNGFRQLVSTHGSRKSAELVYDVA